MLRWWVVFLVVFWTLPVWANGTGEEEKAGLALITGLLLLFSLGATATAGWLMLRGRVSRKVHHFWAYLTLVLALVHAIYNLFFH